MGNQKIKKKEKGKEKKETKNSPLAWQDSETKL